MAISKGCHMSSYMVGQSKTHGQAQSLEGMTVKSYSKRSKYRMDYVNHARRLAEDDWSGVKREEEEEGKRDGEEMDIDPGKKLPKRYANQVSSPETLGPDSPTPPAMLSNPTEINVAVKSMRQEKGMRTSEKMPMCVVYA